MRTIKLILAYDGTAYAGWQRQENVDTIQKRIEVAVSEIEGHPVTVHGAGRTDAGVHALGQVASFELEHALETPSLLRALNARLPTDIRVLSVHSVSRLFHARYDAKRKSYQYRINQSKIIDPMKRLYSWHIPQVLDLDAMQRSAGVLIGTHDFAAFQTASSDAMVKSTTRTVFSIRILKEEPDIVAIDVAGDGFLRYMVRTIVGTVVEFGLGRSPDIGMAEVLATRTRSRAGPTAPAHGLFLLSVDYLHA